MSEIEVLHRDDAKPTEPESGLKRQVLAQNQNLMLVRHLTQKGWQGALYSHPHDQPVYVITGKVNELHVSGRPAARHTLAWLKAGLGGTL